MAFVYRSNQSQNSKRTITPSPTAYQIPSHLKKNQNVAITFVDRTNREIWKNNQNPGPGSYSKENQPNFNNQQVLYETDEIVLIDSIKSKNKGCSSSFKSQSKRLHMHPPDTPGPGHYESSQNKEQKSQSGNKLKKPTQLTKYLFSEAKKEGFAAGYEKDEINVNFLPYNKEEQRIKSAFPKSKKQKESTFFLSKVERTEVSRPMTSIGPGSYNIESSSAALDKKSVKITNNNLKPEVKGNRQIPDFLKQAVTLMPEEVGPGKYTANSTFENKNPSWSQGISCFGSLQSRFSKKKQNKDEKRKQKQKMLINELKNKEKTEKSNQFKKSVPFLSESGRDKNNFISKPYKNNSNVCPGSYEVGNNMYDKVIKKSSSKNKIGSAKVIFGSSVNRFKDENANSKNLSMHQNDNHLTIFNSQQKSEKISSKPKNRQNSKTKKNFWAKTPKFLEIAEEDERPICYDTDTKTFNKKVCEKGQRQAPFLALSQRFKSSNKEDYPSKILNSLQKPNKNISVQTKPQNDHRILKNRIQKFLKQAKSQHKKNSVPVHRIKEERVICDHKENYQNIGPNSYNPQMPKKCQSYNVLFKKPPNQ